MTRLLLATRSRGKQREFAVLLGPLGVEVVSPDQAEIVYNEAEHQLECHPTFHANAAAKAGWFATLSGLITVADDSGLEVEALGGAPGVHSKRFAGRDGPDEVVAAANNKELLRRLLGVSGPDRRARFRCVLAVVDPTSPGAAVHFEGSASGRILSAARGSRGFGYDPLFFSDDLGRSFGEATAAEKDAVSHRGRAVDAWLAARRAGDV